MRGSVVSLWCTGCLLRVPCTCLPRRPCCCCCCRCAIAFFPSVPAGPLTSKIRVAPPALSRGVAAGNRNISVNAAARGLLPFCPCNRQLRPCHPCFQRHMLAAPLKHLQILQTRTGDEAASAAVAWGNTAAGAATHVSAVDMWLQPGSSDAHTQQLPHSLCAATKQATKTSKQCMPMHASPLFRPAHRSRGGAG